MFAVALSPLTAATSSGPGITDWLTGIGTIALAVVTVVAILVNVWAGWSSQSLGDSTYLRVRPEVHQAAAKLVVDYKAGYAPSSATL